MTDQPKDNPERLSGEALLRFLDTLSPSTRPADRGGESRSPSENCPGQGSYLRLVIGTIEGGAAERLLTHATACDACEHQLALSVAALEGTPSPDEVSAIQELVATKSGWQQRLARQLAATQSARQPRLSRLIGIPRRHWALAGTAVAAGLIAIAGLSVWRRQAQLPERQLAMAYSQSRTLELRIPGAEYAGLASAGRTRGSGIGEESAPLLEARARLARNLQSAPQDAHWLQLQARADVLEARYDAAIDVLDRLMAIGPVTSDLLVDDASAYYQRGLVSGSELDRSTALDYLRRADEIAPADPVVLFNEAIVMEDRGQMINAVEVWNRYITMERDVRWAAEGRRKLAALEVTLNKLKSHESRLQRMLATPEAMDALAADSEKLAALDEELSSVQVDKLLAIAFPMPAADTGRARGSPCDQTCSAARRLLQATAKSLEIQHHDFWLSDLLTPKIDELSSTVYANYIQAIRSLGQASREDQTGVPALGLQQAMRARQLFGQLRQSSENASALLLAALAGERRSYVEELFARQRIVDFQGCRSLAHEMNQQPHAREEDSRYPWVHTVALITEMVCDNTPETRAAGRAQLQKALQQAEANRYGLLVARTHLRFANEAMDAGDSETAERLALATLRELEAGDPPPFRIFNTLGVMFFIEKDSPRAYMTELSDREAVAWTELAGSTRSAGFERLDLAADEIRIGRTDEFRRQLELANAENGSSSKGSSPRMSLSSVRVDIAQAMLERGDTNGASQFLTMASNDIPGNSDVWILHRYAATKAQLELSKGNFDGAAQALESNIQESEGKDVHGGDTAMAAEYGALDHDLYAELAASWLGQGRSPQSVLALWERFRLRSRGLAIDQCAAHALNCEEGRLKVEQSRLGSSVLIGQIVLLDRVLVYRMDSAGITWKQHMRRMQDVLDAAQMLEHSVSSPYTTLDTAESLGGRLSASLLPSIPADLPAAASLLLEPDPMLRNLCWPVLPTPSGPLGLHYALAEMQSILADTPPRSGIQTRSSGEERALIVGASVTSPDEEPLPEALTEARLIGGLLHATGRQPQLLLGQDATTARVAQAIESATVFHFAGHAVQSGEGAELLLASSSPAEKSAWVDGAFLRQHPPRVCRLAVLSACSTGERAASWKHPLQDIVETLSSQGVPEVVATRWQIDSEATVPFMNAFYTGLTHGSTVALALTSARRLQSLQPLYRNPYYWGAYYVTGREGTYWNGDLHASLANYSKRKEKSF